MIIIILLLAVASATHPNPMRSRRIERFRGLKLETPPADNAYTGKKYLVDMDVVYAYLENNFLAA